MGTIAVIGGGPSGFVAIKEAVECGLQPVLFEKNSSIGGVWNALTWDSMRTNISRYTCMFSDYAWKEPVEDFPNQRDVLAYLNNYIDHFKLQQYVRLNSNVTKVSKINDKWKVEWLESSKKEERLFDFVIVASGFFSKAVTPSLAGIDSFKGRITHAKEYKNPSAFQGKNVVVVGNAFSGCEIAAEVSSMAAHTVHVVSKSIWILPRYLKAKDSDRKLPGDLVYYSRAAHLRSLGVPANELNQKKNAWFAGICEQQQQFPGLKVTSDPQGPPFLAISDGYVEKVRNGRIELSSPIETISEDAVMFRNESSRKTDEVVFCTGYKPDLSFLDPKVLKSIDYLEDDQFLPLLLHKTVFPKDHSGLAFVGMYRGPFFGVMELQARYACMGFTGKTPLPTTQEIEKGMAEEKNIREQFPRPQFPHGDYVGLCEDIARQINVAPDLKALEHSNPVLHKQLLEGPFTTSSYRLSGFGSKPDLALRYIEQINKKASGASS